MIQLLLILHLLGAAVWIGGHLILCLRFLPKAIKEQNVQVITDFEKQYETIGIPSLLVQIITGILLSYQYGVEWQNWFSFSNSIETVVSIKLLLLFFTMILAAHARIFIIPKLSVQNLNFMAVHIVAITLTGIGMLIVGTYVRVGGI
jgi:uncharacterized membrane protein